MEANSRAAADVVRRLLRKEQALRKALAEGRFDSRPRGLGGRLRSRTLLFSCPAAIALVALAYVLRIHREAQDLQIGIGLVAVPLVGLGLYLLIGDLRVPSFTARRTAEIGLRAFFNALRGGHPQYAYACLLPGERDDCLRVFPVDDGETAGSDRYDFSSLRGFRQYWERCLGSEDRSLSEFRPARISDLHVERQSGDWAQLSFVLHTVRFDEGADIIGPFIDLRFAWAVLTAKRTRMPLRKVLRSVDGQWHLLNGELASPEDDAFDEAARIAGLSDAALAAELAAIR